MILIYFKCKFNMFYKYIHVDHYLFFIAFVLAATDDGEWPRQGADPKQFYDARIDIRKLAQFLTGQQVNPVKVICSKYGSRSRSFVLNVDVGKGHL